MSPIKQKGDFKKTENFLKEASKLSQFKPLFEKYGSLGVQALADSTPVDTGETALSWAYEIQTTPQGYKLIWTNSHIVDGAPIAILIQYGHATRSGSFIPGRDFINPVIRPIFDNLSQELWKEVTSL